MAQLSVVERRLLGTSAARCVRTAALLLALQVPMWTAVLAEATGCVTALRLSLLLDVGFCVALVAAAARLTSYFMASRPSARCRRTGRAAAGALALAGVLGLVEDALLWQGSRAGAYDGACPPLLVPGLSQAWLGLGALGALVLAGAIVSARRELAKGSGDPMREAVLRAPSGAARPGTVIACSGGGIRSASFCLGALQAFMGRGVYRSADAVVGVSGGGYMAAAFHLVGRGLDEHDQPPFAQGTPELALLRRNTRYLLPHGVEVFRGVMSVLYGVAMNLVVIGVTLWGTAWVLGWYLAAYDVLDGSGAHLTLAAPRGWVLVALAPWGAAVVAFVWMEKVLDRFFQVGDDWRRGSRAFTRAALQLGAATVVLMLVVPACLAWLDGDHDAAVARALQVVVTPEDVAVRENLVVLAALAGSLVGLGRTVTRGLDDDAGAGIRGRVVAALRTRVAPWLGSLLILGVAFVAMLRLTGHYATSAAWRADWATALALLAVVVAVRLLTDANRTSLHHFYRERLSQAYLVERVDGRTARARAYRRPVRVSELAGPDPRHAAGPQLVMAAVANVVDEEFVPTGRGCVPFIVAADRTGVLGDRSLPRGGTTPTDRYEAHADYGRRDLTIPAAMAISGAALSPLTGRASARTRPVRVLLTVLNARLGVWLPNPYAPPPAVVERALEERAALGTGSRGTARMRVLAWESAAHVTSVLGKPGPYRLLREAFGRPSLYDRKLYVTDGGHYDNLGLLEALRRRPRRVFVIDASNDAAWTFGALAEAIATARMDLGAEVDIDVTGLVGRDGDRPDRAWAVGRATYDDSDEVTEVVFLKAQLVPDLTWDVEHYARGNRDFPRRSTGDQFYDEWDFEAYRELGSTLAHRMLTDVLGPDLPGPVPRPATHASDPAVTVPAAPRGGQPEVLRHRGRDVDRPRVP